jgi:uncharacterized protein with ParB-like and HNH nuclease domain
LSGSLIGEHPLYSRKSQTSIVTPAKPGDYLLYLEPKLVGDIEGEFYTPSYQRGYRWKEEVEMLLNDIDEIAEGQDYCLQPIVVKNVGEKRYELIDGQQRLTTLFLIFRHMKQLNIPLTLNFSLEYETRGNIRNFLESVNDEKLVDEAKNIDEYFIIETFKTISGWFQSKRDKLLTGFNLYKKLLVKALFLCRNNGIDDAKQLEIATQWDSIEKELQNDALWYFITYRFSQYIFDG